MIRFHLPPARSLHVRIAYSPLWECVISGRVMRHPDRHPLFLAWARRAAPAVARVDLDLLDALVCPGGGYIPDFLAPPPAGPDLTFEAELGRLRMTPSEVIRGELTRAADQLGGGGAARLLARFAGNESRLRDAVAGTIEEYWDKAVAPEWPRIQAVLEGEVIRRARSLALNGPAAVLGALGPAVEYEEAACSRGAPSSTIRVESAQEADVQIARDDLLLVPTVFGWPDVFTVHDPAWRASIYYPARAVGTIWDDGSEAGRPNTAADSLALLAGSARAGVLRALTFPASTTELAARLGASPASVSQHLQRLRRAGLLERSRVGRRVFYWTSSTGNRLLSILGEPPG